MPGMCAGDIEASFPPHQGKKRFTLRVAGDLGGG